MKQKLKNIAVNFIGGVLIGYSLLLFQCLDGSDIPVDHEAVISIAKPIQRVVACSADVKCRTRRMSQLLALDRIKQ